MDREQFMRRAIALSAETMRANRGGPFGCVIVRDGRIMAEGVNCVTTANDPTAHAEIEAIRQAGATLGTFDLSGCELYTSCEPCPMCLAAIYWARIDRIIYANDRRDAAAIDFDDNRIYREMALPREQRSLPIERLLPEEAKAVFDEWAQKQDKTPY